MGLGEGIALRCVRQSSCSVDTWDCLPRCNCRCCYLHNVHVQGLSYLHSVNITHGDLKPGNVLLKSSRLDRRGFTVRLADFGFCRIGGEGQGRRWAQGGGGGLGEGGVRAKGRRGRAGRQAWADTAAALNSRLASTCAELAVRARLGDGVKGEVGKEGRHA